MPLYEYLCRECGHRFETRQGIRDEPLKVCPVCEGSIRRVVQPVGIVFKGSGFYKTDSRSTSAAAVPSGERKAEGAAAGGESTPSSGSTSESASSSTPPPAPGAKTESTGGK